MKTSQLISNVIKRIEKLMSDLSEGERERERDAFYVFQILFKWRIV